jgi:hypothetical protein
VQHLLAAWKNGGSSACVHQRRQPRARSEEDGTHIEFKEATDKSQKKGSQRYSTPTPSSRRRQSSVVRWFEARQAGKEGSAMPGQSSEEAVDVHGCSSERSLFVFGN